MSYEIGNVLEEKIKSLDISVILELGSGKGSERLSEKFEVHSIEYNNEYLNKYSTNYYYVPLKGKWFDSDILEGVLRQIPKYDILLIDAPAGVHGDDRLGILNHLSLFDLSVPIFVDDTHRSFEKKLAIELGRFTGRYIQFLNDGEKQFAII